MPKNLAVTTPGLLTIYIYPLCFFPPFWHSLVHHHALQSRSQGYHKLLTGPISVWIFARDNYSQKQGLHQHPDRLSRERERKGVTHKWQRVWNKMEVRRFFFLVIEFTSARLHVFASAKNMKQRPLCRVQPWEHWALTSLNSVRETELAHSSPHSKSWCSSNKSCLMSSRIQQKWWLAQHYSIYTDMIGEILHLPNDLDWESEHSHTS